MSYFSDITYEITNKIATLKSVVETRKGVTNNKYENVNSLMDSIVEILSTLIGYDKLTNVLEEIIYDNLEDIEEVIKSSIKTTIKKTISCGVEPTIDDDLIYSGFTFDLEKLDPLLILANDPRTKQGENLYFDNNSGVKSKDFNVFLYEVIRMAKNNSHNNKQIWYYNKILDNNELIKKPVIELTYLGYDPNTYKTNQINIKISSAYKDEKLSYFISDFLDSIKLYDENNIIKLLFSRTLNIGNKSLTNEQLLMQNKINSLINKILNTVEKETMIDDSFYEFANDVYEEMYTKTLLTKQGLMEYNGGEIDVDNISLDDILQNNSTLNVVKVKGVIDDLVNSLSNSGWVDETEINNIKSNIIKKLLSDLILTLNTYIFSPKVLLLFQLTGHIYEIDEMSDDPVEFIKNNINLFKLLIIGIRDKISEELIKILTKEVKPLIEKILLELAKEKITLYRGQLKTLIKL